MCALLLIDLVNARGTQRNACGNIHRGRSTPTTLGQHAKLRQQQLPSSQIGYVPPFPRIIQHTIYNTIGTALRILYRRVGTHPFLHV